MITSGNVASWSRNFIWATDWGTEQTRSHQAQKQQLESLRDTGFLLGCHNQVVNPPTTQKQPSDSWPWSQTPVITSYCPEITGGKMATIRLPGVATNLIGVANKQPSLKSTCCPLPRFFVTLIIKQQKKSPWASFFLIFKILELSMIYWPFRTLCQLKHLETFPYCEILDSGSSYISTTFWVSSLNQYCPVKFN